MKPRARGFSAPEEAALQSMERAGATRFFSPPGRSPRQWDEEARVEISRELAPSSDPSGHLLAGGEKKLAAWFLLALEASVQGFTVKDTKA
jgi:hypothetical protein